MYIFGYKKVDSKFFSVLYFRKIKNKSNGDRKMALTKKQMELDQIKWIKSEEAGSDLCGTFDYCVACNKELENPCDKALKKFNKKPVEKKACAKKTCAKKPCAKKASK